MTWTYTPGSSEDADFVRLLSTDTIATRPLFSDEEIGAFLALEGNNVRYAAAQALDTIASNQALLQKAVELPDLKTDGAKLAKELRERATALRAQADASSADDTDINFDWAEMVTGPFSERERLYAQYQRGGV